MHTCRKDLAEWLAYSRCSVNEILSSLLLLSLLEWEQLNPHNNNDIFGSITHDLDKKFEIACGLLFLRGLNKN